LWHFKNNALAFANGESFCLRALWRGWLTFLH
jgi:hypothetical protein